LQMSFTCIITIKLPNSLIAKLRKQINQVKEIAGNINLGLV